MILESVRVENFKCIDDSGEFTTKPLTALVGKNESGKTAILRALYRLNPVVPQEGVFADTEYPRRRWAGFRERRQRAAERVVTAAWRLESADVDAVAAAIGPDALVSTRVLTTKGYDNRTTWHLEVDERRIVAHLIRAAQLDAADLKSLWSVSSVADLSRALSQAEAPSPAQAALLGELERRFPQGSIDAQAIAVLEPRLPKFLYFSEYDRLPAEMSIDDLARRRASGQLTIVDSVFMALLEMAGIDPDDLTGIEQFEYLVAELEAASQRVTRDVLRYWTQNPSLEVEFRCDAARPHDPPPLNTGYVLRMRIRNRRHNVTLSFDERSTGFVWFFSFLVWLTHIRRDAAHDYIILLDEPGLSLHARAQMDMLRFMREQLLPSYQVIYSTHTPFMIDPEYLDGVRTVEDATDGASVLGTKVGDRQLSADPDTLFPIRAALAYDVAKRAVAAPKTLLVDRPSDVLYLKWFSRELERQGRERLEADWSLVPIGGLDSIAPFVTLFASPSARLVVLTDGLMSHPRRLEGLWERGLLQFGRILRPALYLDVDQEDAQLEDLLGRRFYRTLVDGCYRLNEKGVLTDIDGEPAPSTRLVAQVEAHFAALPPWAPRFDSFGPASYLLEHAGELRDRLPDYDAALHRFETLFRDLNACGHD